MNLIFILDFYPDPIWVQFSAKTKEFYPESAISSDPDSKPLRKTQIFLWVDKNSKNLKVLLRKSTGSGFRMQVNNIDINWTTITTVTSGSDA